MVLHSIELIRYLASAKTLAFDYDGTLAPINVPREKSRVFPELATTLSKLAKRYTIVVATTKDCHFIVERTPFAHLWICSNGFEIRIRDSVILPAELLENMASREALQELIAKAYELSGAYNLHIEVKRVGDLVIGFCIDWRNKYTEIPRIVMDLVAEARKRHLNVIEYPGRPFVDIFMLNVDKGWALKKLIELNLVKRPLAYFGDSENDIPAFKVADISVLVLHDENRDLNIETKYRIEQRDLGTVLYKLINNRL